jgi:hypothetical protein
MFRVIPYKKYLEHFASSRKGVRIPQPDGTFKYTRTPPFPNPIVNKRGEVDTIQNYVNTKYSNP